MTLAEARAMAKASGLLYHHEVAARAQALITERAEKIAAGFRAWAERMEASAQTSIVHDRVKFLEAAASARAEAERARSGPPAHADAAMATTTRTSTTGGPISGGGMLPASPRLQSGSREADR
ncbi:MAG: hypothetical protein ACRDGN_17985 [bacterium]